MHPPRTDFALGALLKATGLERDKLPSPLTPAGFDAIIVRLFDKLRRAVRGAELGAVRSFVNELADSSWRQLSAARRERLVTTAATKLRGVAEEVRSLVVGVLAPSSEVLVGASRAAFASAHNLRIAASLSAIDRKVIGTAAEHTALFVRNQFGVRVDTLSAHARQVVASGLEQGFDDRTIGGMLKASLASADMQRTDSYYRTIASTFSARARTYGALSSMREAGVTTFVFSAVLDEVTSDICRFMHGTEFFVRDALDTYQRVVDAPTPDDVKSIQPWAATGVAEDGTRYLYIKQGEERTRLATIVESGVDAVGRYSNTKPPADLARLGVVAPPLHGHCRSSIVPA